MRDITGRLIALDGVRVLDMSEGVAGPYAASMLGDLGADVIKVERPGGDWARTSGRPMGEEFSSCFVAMNRNKRAIGLNLQEPSAADVVNRLITQSDVLISNFRPGVMERLGLGYERCTELNPRIVYCAVSAFGETGPNRTLRGSDTVMQAVSGLMEITGEPDGPPTRVSFPLIDAASALFAVQGVLAALLAGDRRSGAVRIDVSLLNASLALQTLPLTDYLIDQKLPERQGNQNPALSPAGSFQTSGGKYVTVAVLREQHWDAFCRCIGRTELSSDPAYASNALRIANRAALNAVLEPIFLADSQLSWVARLQAADIPCAAVRNYDDVLNDSEMSGLLPIATVDLPGYGGTQTTTSPIQIDGQFPAAFQPPTQAGQDTIAILRELQYSSEEVDGLVNAGAAFLPGAEAVIGH
jgi:crotonobetainyl-CoA:carnitine CoA-transferase CaiB-like acyl-CoA transferase